MNKKQKLLAIVPALWAIFFEAVITIVHQSEEYWNGILNMAYDGYSIGSLLEKKYVPETFISCVLTMIIIGVLGYYLPRKVSRVLLLFMIIDCSWVALGWISKYYGFWFVILFILFNSVLFYFIEDKISNVKT